jgi:hypothetical protein
MHNYLRDFMKTIFIFWVILFLPSIFFAQVENKEASWTTIESPKGDLTFAVPSGFLIDNENGEYQVIAYQNEATIRASVQENGRAKERLNSMRQFPVEEDAKVTRFTLDDFIGDAYSYEKEKSFSMRFYMASSKAFYSISVSSKSSDNSISERFLYSIKLNNQPLLKRDIQPSQKGETKISIASLKTSPVIIEALNRKDAAKTELKYDLDNKVTPEDTIKYSRPLLILRKPHARYADGARQGGVQGTIKLKVHFQANGEVGDITVLSKLDKGLAGNSVDAARQIKFLPAEVDGKPVDVLRIVEYSFRIY